MRPLMITVSHITQLHSAHLLHADATVQLIHSAVYKIYSMAQ